MGITPPQAVINPDIGYENNQSKPGSALGMQTMEPERLLFFLNPTTLEVTCFFVIKFGDIVGHSKAHTSVDLVINGGNEVFIVSK